MEELIFSHYAFAKEGANTQFNTTWLKKLSEKRMIPTDYQVKYIMPLVSIDGLLYVSNERIYMQPLHPQILGESAINIKISKITELFKRRYTLMDLGIEVVSFSAKKKLRKTMYLIFKNTFERDRVYNALHPMVAQDCVTTEKPVEHFT